ncbi:hypothetical protein BT69DRAFT_1281461 [Atractiella rhizophila]|nr:hypothetical protein BT69DRAFT_1281461 [Atractiella rhizophila]
MLEGGMIERFELRLWGDPRLIKSGKWAKNFMNALAESLKRYQSLKEVSVDLSFQYSVKDDMASSALLLASLPQRTVEGLSLGVPGPLDKLLVFPKLNEKGGGVLSSANLKHLTLSIAHNLFDVVARVSFLPSHLLTLKIINRHGYSLDFNFLHALLSTSASSLQEIQIDDFGADIETFNYVSTPIPFRQLHTLTLRADNNRRVGVMKENPDFFVRSFEDCPVKIINVALPEGVDTKLVEELRRRKQRGMLQVWTRIVDVGGVGGFPGAKEETLDGLRALGVEVDLGVGMDLGLVQA